MAERTYSGFVERIEPNERRNGTPYATFMLAYDKLGHPLTPTRIGTTDVQYLDKNTVMAGFIWGYKKGDILFSVDYDLLTDFLVSHSETQNKKVASVKFNRRFLSSIV